MFWNLRLFPHLFLNQRKREPIKGLGGDFNWLEPQQQHGGAVVRHGSGVHLYLKRLIHGSCYATHSKTESQPDLRMEARLPRSCRGDRSSLRSPSIPSEQI